MLAFPPQITVEGKLPGCRSEVPQLRFALYPGDWPRQIQDYRSQANCAPSTSVHMNSCCTSDEQDVDELGTQSKAQDWFPQHLSMKNREGLSFEYIDDGSLGCKCNDRASFPHKVTFDFVYSTVCIASAILPTGLRGRRILSCPESSHSRLGIQLYRYIGYTTIALPIPVLAEDLIAQFWAKLPLLPLGLWLADLLHYYVCLSSGQSRPPRFSI